MRAPAGLALAAPSCPPAAPWLPPSCHRKTSSSAHLPPSHSATTEMDGLEASRRLRDALPPQERPVVVALSADTLQVRRGVVWWMAWWVWWVRRC